MNFVCVCIDNSSSHLRCFFLLYCLIFFCFFCFFGSDFTWGDTSCQFKGTDTGTDSEGVDYTANEACCNCGGGYTLANGELPQTVCIQGSEMDDVNQEYYLTNITYWEAPVYISENQIDSNLTNGYLYLFVDFNSTEVTDAWEWKIATAINDPWQNFTYVIGAKTTGAREIPGKLATLFLRYRFYKLFKLLD